MRVRWDHTHHISVHSRRRSVHTHRFSVRTCRRSVHTHHFSVHTRLRRTRTRFGSGQTWADLTRLWMRPGSLLQRKFRELYDFSALLEPGNESLWNPAQSHLRADEC